MLKYHCHLNQNKYSLFDICFRMTEPASKQIKVERDESMLRTPPLTDEEVMKVKESSKESINDILFKSIREKEERKKFLMERYGVLNPASMKMGPGQLQLHFRTDARVYNGGRCYFNVDNKAYYIRSRKKDEDAGVLVELERYSGSEGDQSVEFYLSGERKYGAKHACRIFAILHEMCISPALIANVM